MEKLKKRAFEKLKCINIFQLILEAISSKTHIVTAYRIY